MERGTPRAGQNTVSRAARTLTPHAVLRLNSALFSKVPPCPAPTEIDRRHLARAIELAEGGRGRVSPNPLVGAVIGRRDEVLGEGFHQALGGPTPRSRRSAPRRDATWAARPCTSRSSRAATRAGHPRARTRSGRPGSGGSWSPPTTRASTHPAAGSGSSATRASRSSSIDGELAVPRAPLNQSFRKHARTGRPWVLFKSAMTLDGKVATRGGDSKWISGEESRRLAHQWRSQCDAVAVGIGTALADDPLLTARFEPRRDPAAAPGRVRLARAPPADLAARPRLPAEIPLTVVVSRAAPRTATDALTTHGAEAIVATGAERARRVSGRRSISSARTGSARSCSKAGPISPARSSTPTRSTRCGCSSRRWCSAAGPRAIPSRARASTRSRTRRGRSASMRARRRGSARVGAASRSGVTRGLDVHRTGAGGRNGRGRRALGRRRPDHDPDAARLRARDRRLDRRQRRVPERGAAPRRRSRPTR